MGGGDLGQRLGSGSSESPYFKSAGTKVSLLLRQTQEILRLARFLMSPTFLMPPLISSSAASFHTAGGHAGVLLPQPLFLLARIDSVDQIQYTVFSAEPEREAFRKFHFSAAYKSVLTRLLALIFLVSTLFSAVIFLMFS